MKSQYYKFNLEMLQSSIFKLFRGFDLEHFGKTVLEQIIQVYVVSAKYYYNLICNREEHLNIKNKLRIVPTKQH